MNRTEALAITIAAGLAAATVIAKYSNESTSDPASSGWSGAFPMLGGGLVALATWYWLGRRV